MFLSFIIPVYNAETYLSECLDSLLNQDIPQEDYEILCVNDGSRDGSPAILNAYAAKHPNVVVIHKDNGGVTTARNVGLEAARGEYIWFVDADDLIVPNCLGQLKSLSASGCDRIVFDAYLFDDAMTDALWAALHRGELTVNTPWYDAVVWRSLLRKAFLQQHDLYFRYPELTHGEDGLFMYEVALQHPVMEELDRILYFYRHHSGSAETATSPESRMRKIRSYIRIASILQIYFQQYPDFRETTANKLMSFLWMALYGITKLPTEQAREALAALKAESLFPFRRPAQCNITKSYMTEQTGLVGFVFEKVYLHLHRPWGYAAMRLLWKLKP